MLAAAANVVLVLIYGAIAWTIIAGIAQGKQWSSNPIAVATGFIFVTCTLGHGFHLLHAVLPFVGLEMEAGMATRATFADWRLWVWDGFTAMVAVWYWSLRHRLAIIYGGAALCEDLEARQRQAAELHEGVVAGLHRAKACLDAGRREEGARELDETLAASRRIISGLLGEEEERVALRPGDLRRDAASR